jgi:hypothetical protein
VALQYVGEREKITQATIWKESREQCINNPIQLTINFRDLQILLPFKNWPPLSRFHYWDVPSKRISGDFVPKGPQLEF